MNTNRTEPILATYLHEKGSRLGLPISGTFELTSRCNFSCPMCYVHSSEDDMNKKSAELSTEKWISVVRSAVESGMMFALITGGEPFLRQDFFDIYGEMKKTGVMVSINTNGSLIKGEVLRKLINNPPFRVNISLYGASRKTYSEMCRNDAFDDVINAVKALKEAGIDTRLNLSLTPFNQQDIKGIFEIAKELGVHIKFNSYMYPAVRSNNCGENCRFDPYKAAYFSTIWDSLRLTDGDFDRRCRNIADIVSAGNEGCVVESEEILRCRAGRSSFWITFDGKLLPCGMMKTPRIDLTEASFNEAWETIKEESKKLTVPSECAECKKRNICNVCPAVCVAETGSFVDVPEYMCKYTDELMRLAGEHLMKG